jgi:hypothetical protein
VAAAQLAEPALRVGVGRFHCTARPDQETDQDRGGDIRAFRLVRARIRCSLVAINSPTTLAYLAGSGRSSMSGDAAPHARQSETPQRDRE